MHERPRWLQWNFTASTVEMTFATNTGSVLLLVTTLQACVLLAIDGHAFSAVPGSGLVVSQSPHRTIPGNRESSETVGQSLTLTTVMLTRANARANANANMNVSAAGNNNVTTGVRTQPLTDVQTETQPETQAPSTSDVNAFLGLDMFSTTAILHSLACSKFPVLRKFPATRTVAPTDRFTVNIDFHPPPLGPTTAGAPVAASMLVLPLPTLEPPPRTSAPPKAPQDNSFVLDATLVLVLFSLCVC